MKFQMILISVFLLASLTNCSTLTSIVNGRAIDDEMVKDTALQLNVARKLYVNADIRSTYFQHGYAVRKRKRDKYTPYCRFSFDYTLAGDSDTTIIQPQSMGIVRISRNRHLANADLPTDFEAKAYQVAHNGSTDRNTLIMANSNQLDTLTTTLLLQSTKQPWIRALDCDIFASSDNYLTLVDIATILQPAMRIEPGDLNQ